MDTYENQDLFPQEEPICPEPPVAEPEREAPVVEEAAAEVTVVKESAAELPASAQPESAAYHNRGAGRKESPYADSPYVMYHQQQRETPSQPQPEKVNKPKAKRNSRGLRIVLAVFLVLALVVSSCCITAALVNMRWDEALYQTEKDFNEQLNRLEQQLASAENRTNAFAGSSVAPGEALSPAQVYAQSVDSVVAISTTIQQPNIFGQVTEGSSAGSGFILTADGYVVTNYHVVESASSVNVITHDGTKYPANIVGYDATNDVAVLKVDAKDLPAVTIGSSDDLIIGDMVVAIGNPLGELASTQTVGYVSGIGREVSTDSLTTIRMIQTDAAINPGNSGGPLFNMRGEVIGITTAKYSGTTASGASIEGIGFAIPIDDVMALIPDLMDYGFVTGAYLGVSVRNTDPNVTSMYGLPDGAQVLEVVEGISAHRAGVQINDIIVALGEYEVTNVTTLTRALRNFKAGDTTTITVVRGGAEVVLSITLDAKPGNLTNPTVPQDENMPDEGDYEEWRKYFFGE